MQTTVLYHGNCPDGFGAAFAAWLKFGDNVTYIPVNYGQPFPQERVPHGSEVYILDFSYPADVIETLALHMTKVLVLDHHQTAQKDMAELASRKPDLVKFDMAKSGAVLAWEHFFPEISVPLLIQYLQDRDLWHFKLPLSRAVSAYIQTWPFDFNVWAYEARHHLDERLSDEIKTAGASLLKLKNQQVEIMAKNNRRVCFEIYSDGRKAALEMWCNTEGQIPFIDSHPNPGVQLRCVVPVANATVFFSEVGEKLLEMFPEAPFAAYYLDRADSKRQWGLRSRPEFDCSVISKAFGGGGHKQASGFVQDI